VTVDLTPSLRERKKRATRRAIHEAAVDLVEDLGLSRVTVEAISARANVSPRTFWSYFSSKEDAVINRDPKRPEALRRALAERPAGEDALTALRHVLEADLIERVGRDRVQAVRRSRLVRQEPELMAAVAAAFDEIEPALVEAVAARTGEDPETDLYPALVVSAACGACRVAQLRWSDEKGRPSLGTLVRTAFDHLASGLVSPRPGQHERLESLERIAR